MFPHFFRLGIFDINTNVDESKQIFAIRFATCLTRLKKGAESIYIKIIVKYMKNIVVKKRKMSYTFNE